MTEKDQEVEIDLMQLFHALLHRFWALLLAAAIAGSCALAYTALFVQPLYQAKALMYVNNNSLSVGDTKVSVSQGDLTAAKSLVDTYSIILKTRSTLEDVIEEAQLSCTYEQLRNMITAGSVNGTEIFDITVTSPDAGEAEKIANTIAQILPDKIASIVEGCSARIVDYAVKPAHKSSPSLSKNAVLGALVGFVIAAGVVVVKELMDDEIRDTDYLMQTYDIPMLAVIPDLQSTRGSSYSYESNYAPAGRGGRKNG